VKEYIGMLCVIIIGGWNTCCWWLVLLLTISIVFTYWIIVLCNTISVLQALLTVLLLLYCCCVFVRRYWWLLFCYVLLILLLMILLLWNWLLIRCSAGSGLLWRSLHSSLPACSWCTTVFTVVRTEAVALGWFRGWPGVAWLEQHFTDAPWLFMIFAFHYTFLVRRFYCYLLGSLRVLTFVPLFCSRHFHTFAFSGAVDAASSRT